LAQKDDITFSTKTVLCLFVSIFQIITRFVNILKNRTVCRKVLVSITRTICQV